MISTARMPSDETFEVTQLRSHLAQATAPNQGFHHDKRELLQRIVQSKSFRRSQRPTDFLLYVCQQAINGRTDELSEQDIGENVFARGESFDPGLDNIVRVTARRVRQKLDEYYSTEGQSESVVISIPVGGYVPRFDIKAEPPLHRASEPEVQLNAASSGSAPSAAAGSVRIPYRWLAVVITVLFVAAGVGLVRQLRQHKAAAVSATQKMWSALLAPDCRNIFVPGDSALVLLENHTHQPVALADYINKSYLQEIPPSSLYKPDVEREEAARAYNSVVDVRFAARLARRPEAQEPIDIVLPRDLRMEDLKESNVILSGAREANPWVQMFQDQLAYWIIDRQQGDNYTVVNRHPLPGEPATYSYKADDPRHVAYGVVAYLPNLSGQGKVLLVEGTTMAGTEVAMDFVLDSDALNRLLTQHLRNHQVPSFQVLLRTINVDGSSSKSEILSYRF